MNYKVYQRNYNLSLLDQVLYNRGIASEKERIQFLHPTEDVINNKYELENIIVAAKELCRALAKKEHIHIVVDSDTDGYTSASLLINYLYRIFPTIVTNYITYNVHDSKHHGIDINAIPEGVKLVIAPDSSSNEVEIHKWLAEQGIHTIVLDHHQAEKDETDPAIIVNNQMCFYKNKNLSGVGIVYKFCEVLDEIFQVSYARDYLDLVSLGNLADMMDLREPETHYYIIEGSKKINNIFYNKIIEKQEYSMRGEVNPFTVSWYVAPLINAVTRSGTLKEKMKVFEAFLDFKAVEVVKSTKRGAKNGQELRVDAAVRLATNIKSRQERTKKDALEQITSAVEECADDPVVFAVFEKPIDENLNGLLANQIMGNTHKPTLVLNKCEDGYYRGSARGYESNTVHDWREYIEDSGCAEYAQGHPFAFGCSFSADGLINFRKKVFKELQDGIQAYYDIDFSYSHSDCYDKEILTLGNYQGLWGQNVQEPLVMIEHVALTKNDIQLLGKGTLKITLPGHETSCIKFGAEDIYNNLMQNFVSNPDAIIFVNIIGTCAINEFRGNVSPQIKIKDYEVTGVQDWYF